MQVFKNEHVFNKLKEDAHKLEDTMSRLDDQLSRPCEIKGIEKSWPAEQLLRTEINDAMGQRIEIEEIANRSQESVAEIIGFREATENFIKNMNEQLNNFHSHFMKYGMKPMNREVPEPITNGHEDVMVNGITEK